MLLTGCRLQGAASRQLEALLCADHKKILCTGHKEFQVPNGVDQLIFLLTGVLQIRERYLRVLCPDRQCLIQCAGRKDLLQNCG